MRPIDPHESSLEAPWSRLSAGRVRSGHGRGLTPDMFAGSAEIAPEASREGVLAEAAPKLVRCLASHDSRSLAASNTSEREEFVARRSIGAPATTSSSGA